MIAFLANKNDEHRTNLKLHLILVILSKLSYFSFQEVNSITENRKLY